LNILSLAPIILVRWKLNCKITRRQLIKYETEWQVMARKKN